MIDRKARTKAEAKAIAEWRLRFPILAARTSAPLGWGTRSLCECRFPRRVSGYGDDADVVFLAEGLGGVGDPGG